MRHEMARTLKDILFRRTGLGTLGHPGDKVLKRVADLAAKELKWNSARLKKELREAAEALAVPL